MATTKPNAANVATGKPKIDGAIFSALTSSAFVLPTDATTAIADPFVQLGYAAEGGLRNGGSMTTSETKAWGGATVFDAVPSKTDTFTFKLIEATNVDVLKVVYGSANVTGTVDEGVTVSATTEEHEDRAWIFDMILHNVQKRIVVPSAKITNIAEVVYNDSDVVGYEITISCTPDADGKTHYEYLKKKA